jgi:hypothetical protein
MDTPSMRMARFLLLPSSLQSMAAFMQRPASVIFFDLHRQKILDGMDEVLIVRGKPEVRFYKYLNMVGVGQYIVSDTTKGLLDNVVLHKDLRATLKDIRGIIDKLNQMVHPDGKPKAPKYIALVDSAAAERSRVGQAAVAAQSQVVHSTPVLAVKETSRVGGTGIVRVSESQSTLLRAPQTRPESNLAAKVPARLTNT